MDIYIINIALNFGKVGNDVGNILFESKGVPFIGLVLNNAEIIMVDGCWCVYSSIIFREFVRMILIVNNKKKKKINLCARDTRSPVTKYKKLIAISRRIMLLI